MSFPVVVVQKSMEDLGAKEKVKLTGIIEFPRKARFSSFFRWRNFEKLLDRNQILLCDKTESQHQTDAKFRQLRAFSAEIMTYNMVESAKFSSVFQFLSQRKLSNFYRTATKNIGL